MESRNEHRLPAARACQHCSKFGPNERVNEQAVMKERKERFKFSFANKERRWIGQVVEEEESMFWVL